MFSFSETGTVLSSSALRLFTYIFLRWVIGLNLLPSSKQWYVLMMYCAQIPGHQLPPLIYFSLISYLGFLALTRQSAAWSNRLREAKRKSTEIRSLADTQANRIDGNNKKVDGIPLRQGGGPKISRSLLLGLPSPISTLWSTVAVALNIVLALFVADMVYRPQRFYKSSDLSFARVGYVSDTAASILIREPNSSQLPIHISYRSAPEVIESHDAWHSAGKLRLLSNATDITGSLTISNLIPASQYQYTLSNKHTGFLSTAPPEATGKLTFLASSCIKANFPYNPLSHPLSIIGFRHVANWIPSLGASFMLFLGDFIYIDVPKRFGSDVESYRQQYRQVYASNDFPAVSRSLPWIHVIDDHDIAND